MPEAASLPSVADVPVSLLLLASSSCADAADIVHAWKEHLTTLKRPHEILLILPDSSSDLPALRESPIAGALVTYSDQEGDGFALRAGLPRAQHPLVLIAPATREFYPPDVDRVLQAINDVHLVCGYRVHHPVPGWVRLCDFATGILTRLLLGYMPPPREFWMGSTGWGRRWAARWIFGLRLQDVECRLRLFRREVLDEFPIQSRGTFAHVEMLAKANHLGCIMAETPATWTPPPQMAADPNFARDAALIFNDPEFRDPTMRQAPLRPAPAEGEMPRSEPEQTKE